MFTRKIAVQNKSPSFGMKQPILLSAVAKTTPKLYKFWPKVFALSKTVNELTIAATDPKNDDQLAENLGKSLGREDWFEENSA